MKRIVSAILLSAMLFSLAACGEKPAPAPEPSPAPVTEPVTEPESVAETEPAAEPESEPLPAREFTREEKQQIVVQSALAYFYRNPHVQYDDYQDIMADGTKRTTFNVYPEEIDADTQMISDCASFIFEVFRTAFGYKLMGSGAGSTTANLVAMGVSNPMVVCKYGSDGESDLDKAMQEARAALQPGDIIVGRGKSGHAMLFVGDLYGDGHEYLIHCWGGNADLETGKDKIEANGAIFVQDVDESCFQPGGTRGWYLADPNKGAIFSIVRPLDAEDFPAQPLDSAVSRLDYAGIDAVRSLGRTRYDSVYDGEQVPVTVTVTNNGTADFTALTVTEYIPEGQTLVPGSISEGGTAEGNTIRWTLTVPAGGKTEVSYQVQVSGTVGDEIVFPAGLADRIPTREFTMRVGFRPLSEEQQITLLTTGLASLPAELTTGEYFDLDFANRFYRSVLGAEAGLPATTADLVEGTLQRKSPMANKDVKLLIVREKPVAEFETVSRMILPHHPCGAWAGTPNGTIWRVRDYYQTTQYQPGDIFVCTYGANGNRVLNDREQDIFIYLGSGNVLSHTKEEGTRLLAYSNTVALGLKYNLVLVLRPTLALDISK